MDTLNLSEAAPLMKDEKYGQADASEARGVNPAKFLAEVGNGKDGEDGEVMTSWMV